MTPFQLPAPAAAAVPGQRTPASLQGRVPGQSVMSELLELQAGLPRRGSLRRLLGCSPLHPDGAPWYLGALGEIAVGRHLSRLGPAWTVLHAVPVGKKDSDIDHVVIGPGGVFTVNTKHHAGKAVWVAGSTFMVSGRKQPHLRNSAHEAERAGKLLSTAVGTQVAARAVIAVVAPKSLTIRRAAEGAHVLTDHKLTRWLQKQPVVLTAAQVAALSAAASVPATWKSGMPPITDPAAMQATFSRLNREVRRARVVRTAWAGVTGLGAAAAAVSVGPELLTAALSSALS